MPVGIQQPIQNYSTIKDNFYLCIPLNFFMGSFEDYKKIISNTKQKLVLVRTNEDKNSINH